MKVEAIGEHGDVGRRFSIPLLDSLELVINTFRIFDRISILE